MRLDRILSFEKMSYYMYIFSNILVFSFYIIDASEILRPRGVSISKASLYVPEHDFTCFDGSATIPFIYVNDDYCDCEDGSDEPGTPACPNGTFHCTNAGHRPLNIPSSRVNDGICDCCDTSDEYASQANCVNNCNELGRAARAEAQKLAELTKQGSELRIQLSKKGKQIRHEKQEKLNQLEKDHAEAERLKKEKEGLKISIEDMESNALEKYQVEDELKKHAQQEEEKHESEKEAFEFFHKLDSNQDGKLQISEIQTRQTFDQNKDGAVSTEEAKFFLDQHEEMSWEDYVNFGWPRMKPLLMLDRGMFQPPENRPDDQVEEGRKSPDEQEQGDEDLGESDEEEEEEEEDEEDKPEEPHPEELDPTAYEEDDENENVEEGKEGEVEEVKPKYDEETQGIIDQANKIRSEYEEAENNVRDIQREIQQIKDSLQKDFGPEEEFAPLDGECFEYTDNEYVYKLCPFDQSTQRSKSGGSDARLGSWSGWIGPEDNKYQIMLFDGGQSCWNGPQRSTKVKLSCGTENSLTSVSEPNRCEYVFEFVTPSICQTFENVDSHDEL